MDSILNTVKTALGVDPEYSGFDTDILLGINSAFSNLNQLGVGPESGFIIKGESELWENFLPESVQLGFVKSYILYKVRLSFDPPASSYLMDSIQKQIAELEWRLMVQVDPPIVIDSSSEDYTILEL